jgi:hypothetical protein
MLAQFLTLVLLAGTWQVEGRPPEMPVLQSRLGGTCSAEFLVTDQAGAPVYNATIHVRVRYGALGIKRADLEVGSDAAGKARIEGLPNKARPLIYDIEKDGRKASVRQDVANMCEATFTVALK